MLLTLHLIVYVASLYNNMIDLLLIDFTQVKSMETCENSGIDLFFRLCVQVNINNLYNKLQLKISFHIFNKV